VHLHIELLFTFFYATAQVVPGLMGNAYPPGNAEAVLVYCWPPTSTLEGPPVSPCEIGKPTQEIRSMSADWFYLKRRWFGGTKKVGPLAENDLLLRIDRGEITPTTLLISAKTKNRWVKMEEIGPALKQWKKGHPVSEQTGPN